VFRELMKQESAAGLAHGSPRLLVRHPALLDEQGRQQLRDLLDRYEVLRTVVDFRDRLQRIWDDASASHDRAVEQLRELCAQAEGSSILALGKFVLRLRAYAPVPGATVEAEFS
jgi:hypothetical protein